MENDKKNIIDKEKHYTRGRDIAPITGMIVETSMSVKYQNELSRMAAKEYLQRRFKELYGSLDLKEDDQLDKLYEITLDVKSKIIDHTRNGLTIENISKIKDMPSYSQIKEIITSDTFFHYEYVKASSEGAVFLVDDLDSITKDFIQGNCAPHIDAVGLNSITKALSTVAKMKNPERYGENAKTVINNNTQINNGSSNSPQEIKMVIEAFIDEIEDKRILETLINKARNRLDDLINKELNV